jgi:hypothetical protein
MKRLAKPSVISVALVGALSALALAGCGSSSPTAATTTTTATTSGNYGSLAAATGAARAPFYPSMAELSVAVQANFASTGTGNVPGGNEGADETVSCAGGPATAICTAYAPDAYGDWYHFVATVVVTPDPAGYDTGAWSFTDGSWVMQGTDPCVAAAQTINPCE